MFDWQYGIGEWVVINEDVRLGSPYDVGRLAYVKELLTDKYYNYRVCTYKNTEVNVRESEINPIPKDKLDYYLKVSKWEKAKPKQYNDECEIVKLDFLSEKAYLENAWGLKYTLAFKEIEEIKGDGEMESKVVDNVNQPDHYTHGGIETLEFMKAKLKAEAFQGFLTGNVIKYISRFEFKNGVEDLKKARVYLDRLIREKENALKN